jgi:hypothetical protein
VFVTETPEVLALKPYDAELEVQFNAGCEVMRRYHETFRQLAE